LALGWPFGGGRAHLASSLGQLAWWLEESATWTVQASGECGTQIERTGELISDPDRRYDVATRMAHGANDEQWPAGDWDRGRRGQLHCGAASSLQLPDRSETNGLANDNNDDNNNNTAPLLQC